MDGTAVSACYVSDLASSIVAPSLLAAGYPLYAILAVVLKFMLQYCTPSDHDTEDKDLADNILVVGFLAVYMYRGMLSQSIVIGATFFVFKVFLPGCIQLFYGALVASIYVLHLYPDFLTLDSCPV